MASAAEHNAEGNAAFKQGDYDAAYRHYSKAIKADSSVAKYWTNRANSMWRCVSSPAAGIGPASLLPHQPVANCLAGTAVPQSSSPLVPLCIHRLDLTRQVVEDADAAIKADPAWVKGYYFRQVVHTALLYNTICPYDITAQRKQHHPKDGLIKPGICPC